MSNLSDAIREVGLRKEEERKIHELLLGEPCHFIQDEDATDHGIGFFRTGPDTIVVYRKYSNGYERYPTVIYHKDFVTMLFNEFKK